jgi:hypothetical protein
MRISVWNLVTNWPRTLKWWERFKLVFHPILIISILFISLVPSYFQQESLSRVYEGITLPSSEVSLNLNFTDPTTVHILFPYEIENNGFYDLSHINLRVALFIEYFHITTGEQHRSKVLYSKDEQGYARMGESYAGLYEKNFLDFNWEGIDAFVLDIDNNRPINVYMDIELSFILSGVEEDRIIFQGINLTSSTNSSMLNTNGYIIKNGGREGHNLVLLISLLGIIGISLTLYHQRKKIFKSHNLNERGRNIIQFISSKKKILIGSAKNMVFTALFLAWDFLVILAQIISGVFTSEYIAWTMIVFVSTIILIGIIDWLSILPSLRPRSYWKYSFKERKRTFFSSTISLFVVILWSTTGYISYAVNSSILIIRNTIFSFFPIIFLLSLNSIIKGVDLVIASRSKIFFQKLKVEQEAKQNGEKKSISSKEEFNIEIFKAINRINEAGKSATISQIKKSFRSKNIPFIFKKHVRINSEYIETLVSGMHLSKIDKIDSPYYALTPKSRSILTQETLERSTCETCGSILDETDIICPNCTSEEEPVKDLFCSNCGMELDDNSSICKECASDKSIQLESNYCQKCGALRISATPFCVKCYHSFDERLSRWRKYDIDALYTLSWRIDSLFKVLYFCPAWIALFLFYFSVKVGMNLFNLILQSSIISIFFLILIIFFWVQLSQIKQERIFRDRLYKIKFTIIHSSEHGSISDEEFKDLDQEFKSFHVKIRHFANQIRAKARHKRIFFSIFLFLEILGVLLLVYGFIEAVFLLMVGLIFLVLKVRNADVRCLDDMFQLASKFSQKKQVNFVSYITNQVKFFTI